MSSRFKTAYSFTRFSAFSHVHLKDRLNAHFGHHLKTVENDKKPPEMTAF